ncbi:ABC transporter ATP-binding protein [candidate division WOR-3 bacterium]|nr:ABC transporter ATP-binding protein [candidate division WOR-3 bacterium]
MIFRIEDLHFEKGGKEILKGVNLAVKKNSIHTIIGVNGTGKTTLASLIMGLEGYIVKSGKILFEGEDISKLSITERAKKGITLGWQIPTSFEGITVREYLNINNKDLKPEESLQLVGLNPTKYLPRLVNEELSGGERKRIELSSILSMKPKFAVLDEPDSGIDINSIHYIKKALLKLLEMGSTVLIISHNEFIADFSDKVSLLCGGQIIKEGKNKEVIDYFKNHCMSCEHVGVVDKGEL